MGRKRLNASSTPTTFFYNGLSAAFSSLMLRFGSMIFNIYLSSAAGAGAMGLMSLIYSVWGFALSLGCASGGFFSSRITAEEISLNGDIFKCTKKSVSYCLLVSFIVSSLLFILSPFFGDSVLKDTRCITPLRIISFSLPFISVGGVFDGYFNACTRSFKVAFLRVIEQILRISFTVLIFFSFGSKGEESACINIVTAGVLTEIISFIILFSVFIFDRRKHFKRNGKDSTDYKKIASLSIPVTLTASLRSGLISTEHILIPRGLVSFGMSYDTALALFGTVHGMALPIVLFCYALPSAFSSLLIPKIAEYKARENFKEIRYVAKRAYRLALIFSIALSAFMILSAYLLGEVFYPGKGAGKYIYMLAPLIPIMYIDSVSDSFLKGMNRQLYSMKINIFDSLISIACVMILTPKFGILGYIIAIYASESFNTCASLIKVISLTKLNINPFKLVIIPLLSALASSKITDLFYKLSSYLLEERIALIFGGLIFILLYSLTLIFSKNIDKEERGWILNLLIPKK